MSLTHNLYFRAARQPGFSLIELMVALLIGVLIIIGAVSVYVQSRNTFRVTEAVARLQETGRYAMEVLVPDIRMAGYWGLHNRAEYITNSAGPGDTLPAGLTELDDCGDNWATNTVETVTGTNQDEEYPFPDTCAPYGSDDATAWQPGSDILVIRRASSEPAAPANGTLQIQSSRLQSALFQNGTLPPGFAPPTTTESYDLVANAYYVSRNSTGRAGMPSLRRKRLISGPAIRDEEIAPGIEDFQIRFGIDTDGDQEAESFVDPNAVAGNPVVAVRVWLLVRALEQEQGFVDSEVRVYAGKTVPAPNDKVRRILVERTIQLRNTRP